MPNRQKLQQLLDILYLDKIDDCKFIGQNLHPQAQRLYGGQVLAQVLRAAVATVDSDRRVHSQHAYFLRPGDPQVPLTLEVENARDGGSFSSRRVVALQHGKPILVSSLSFHIPEQGRDYQSDMPDVPGPEELLSERELELAKGSLNPEFMITTGEDLDVRMVDPVDWDNPVPREPVLYSWMKTTGPIADEPGLHEAVLAYMSDASLIDVGLVVHGMNFHEDAQCASLDHAMWFHSEFRADEWLLYVVDSQVTGGSRGLGRGRFYTRDGRLVATTMQEGLMRERR